MTGIVTLECTNKVTGRTTLEMVSSISEARGMAIRLAGHAGYLDFLHIEKGSRDLHAENLGYVIDIMV